MIKNKIIQGFIFVGLFLPTPLWANDACLNQEFDQFPDCLKTSLESVQKINRLAVGAVNCPLNTHQRISSRINNLPPLSNNFSSNAADCSKFIVNNDLSASNTWRDRFGA